MRKDKKKSHRDAESRCEGTKTLLMRNEYFRDSLERSVLFGIIRFWICRETRVRTMYLLHR